VPGKLLVLHLRLFVHGAIILRTSDPNRIGKGAAMPFSSKAQEIHDHIVSTGKADYWTGVAKLLADRRGQHRPGKPYSRSIHALRHELKAELSDAVNDANDHHWEEIAHWLAYEARLH
jgi:hypothetical protein